MGKRTIAQAARKIAMRQNVRVSIQDFQEFVNEQSQQKSKIEITERILCAAIHYDDGTNPSIYQPEGIESGFVVSGFRHGSIVDSMERVFYADPELYEITKGFLTNRNRFVNRKQALKIATIENQIIHNIQIDPKIGLTSEDIY